MTLLSNPVEAVVGIFKDAFSKDSLETLFHTGLGFGGAVVGSRLVYKQLITALDKPIGRVATTLGVSILESLAFGYVGGRTWATRALAGGLLATAWQGLTEIVSGTEAAEWIPTLGDGESAEFRKAIEEEVLAQMRGEGGAVENDEGMSIYLQPAGVSETYLEPAGTSAYLTAREAVRAEESAPAGMDAYLTSREVQRITGMGATDSEFGGDTMPEQF